MSEDRYMKKSSRRSASMAAIGVSALYIMVLSFIGVAIFMILKQLLVIVTMPWYAMTAIAIVLSVLLVLFSIGLYTALFVIRDVYRIVQQAIAKNPLTLFPRR